eukprot:gene12050-8302_t
MQRLSYAAVLALTKAVPPVALLLDVRGAEECAGGMIPTAKNIPLDQLQTAVKKDAMDFKTAYGFEKPAFSDRIVVYCLRGGRAEQGAGILSSNGYTNVDLYPGSWSEWFTCLTSNESNKKLHPANQNPNLKLTCPHLKQCAPHIIITTTHLNSAPLIIPGCILIAAEAAHTTCESCQTIPSDSQSVSSTSGFSVFLILALKKEQQFVASKLPSGYFEEKIPVTLVEGIAGLDSFPSPRCCYDDHSCPSEEHVRAAFRVLGVPSHTTSLADIKKKYVDLVKLHHPDVSATGNGSTSSKMTEINNAYGTVTAFLKAGRRLIDPTASHATSTTRERYEQWEDPHYVPFYEMMWEEMREQAAAAAAAAELYEDAGFSVPRRPKHHRQRARGKNSNFKFSEDGTEGNTKKQKDKSPRDNWNQNDKDALMHMYEDGKSFEFIANALNKTAPEVVEEFNRWKNELRQRQKKFKPFVRHRKPSCAVGSYPFHLDEWAADDDYFEEDDYDYDDEGELYGYGTDWGEAIPYQHRHRMANDNSGARVNVQEHRPGYTQRQNPGGDRKKRQKETRSGSRRPYPR